MIVALYSECGQIQVCSQGCTGWCTCGDGFESVDEPILHLARICLAKARVLRRQQQSCDMLLAKVEELTDSAAGKFARSLRLERLLEKVQCSVVLRRVDTATASIVAEQARELIPLPDEAVHLVSS